MTDGKGFKKLVRERMAKTGESYTTARANLEGRIATARPATALGSSSKRPRYFEVFCDYETSAHAGAGGAFQVIALEEDGQDVTHLVDQGIHFFALKELQHHLARVTGDEVDVEEIESAEVEPGPWASIQSEDGPISSNEMVADASRLGFAAIRASRRPKGPQAQADLRKRLVLEARLLLETPYRNGALASYGSVPLEAISCSGVVLWVFSRVFPNQDPRVHLVPKGSLEGDASGMFHGLAPTSSPEPGDLSFYTRPGDPLVHGRDAAGNPRPEWHVMFVATATRVVGACPAFDRVVEMEDHEYRQHGRWTWQGHRRFPFDSLSLLSTGHAL